jgi:RNA polymerase sigma factor (sigma-70 family)
MVIHLTATTKQTMDPVLLSFISAPDETTSAQLLQEILVEEAEPLINSIVRSKLQTSPIYRGAENEESDLDDVCGEVIVRLVRRLRELKAQPEQSPLGNLRGYITTMAYNACDEYLRYKYPARHRLKNRLRYMVTHITEFGLWETDDRRWICGFAHWRNVRSNVPTGRTPDRLLNGIDDFRVRALPGTGATQIDPGDLLKAIFDRIGGPIEFDDLVGVVADLWGIKDHLRPMKSESDQLEVLPDGSFDPRPDLEGAIDRQRHLRRVWAEICQLSSRQRAALLLSLRDQQGRSVLALLPVAGIAGIRQIAEALDLDAERLLEIWEELPLEDSKIGQQLSVTPQQVVNLRKSARERLARRTKSPQKGRKTDCA